MLKYFFNNRNIIVTDRVKDVERYMSAMDVFVLPSYREGFGMSVVEAEAMGVPVIVTDIPGPRNAIIDGLTGLLIPIKNHIRIVESVDYLLKNKVKLYEMGKKGAEYASKNFDSIVFSKKIIENRVGIMEKR